MSRCRIFFPAPYAPEILEKKRIFRRFLGRTKAAIPLSDYQKAAAAVNQNASTQQPKTILDLTSRPFEVGSALLNRFPGQVCYISTRDRWKKV
jgi:hypothetical protein